MTAVPRRGPVLSALRTAQPEVWRAEVRKALERHLYVEPAAEALGIGHRTLQRWIGEHPDLTKGLDLPGRGRPVKGA